MLDQFRAQKLEWNRANNQIYDRVETSSGDSNGRTLFVQISNGGTVEDLTGATLSLAWSKRAEQGLETFEEVDAKKGQFRLFYPTGMLVNHGVLRASLVLVDVTGRIESKPFDIIVHKGTVDDEAVESDNKFTALTTALVKVSQVQAEFDGLYADKSQMMDTLHDDKKADMEALEADYSNRANTLEATYAPRLTEVSAQLAQTETRLNNDVFLKENGININDMDEPTRQTFLEAQGIDVNYVLGKGNVKPENTTFYNFSTNLFDKNSITPNKTIHQTYLTIIDNPYYSLSKPLHVEEGDVFTAKGVVRVGYQDETSTIISAEGLAVDQASTFTVPAGVRYVLLVAQNNVMDTVQLNSGNTLLPFEEYKAVLKDIVPVDNRLKNVESEVIDTFESSNIFDKTNITPNKTINQYMEVVDNDYYSLSCYFKVQPGDTFTGFGMVRVGYCDENKTIMSREEMNANMAVTITVPADAEYIVFVVNNSRMDVAQINKGTELLPYEEYYAYPKMLEPFKNVLTHSFEEVEEVKKFALELSTVEVPAGIGEIASGRLSLIATKKDNYYNAKNLPIQDPQDVGYLYLDESTEKLYYSAGKFDRPEFLFDWDLTIAEGSPCKNWVPVITKDGDIIFLTQGKEGRRYPIVYPSGNYNNPVKVETTETYLPGGMTTDTGACVSSYGDFMIWGEYQANGVSANNGEPMRIWKVSKPYTNPSDWRVVDSWYYSNTGDPWGQQPDREITHFHTIAFDHYTGDWIANTGDHNEFCRVIVSTDDGETWNEVASNGQKWRTLGYIFTEDGCYWGTDAGHPFHNLYKADRDVNGKIDFSTITQLAQFRYEDGSGNGQRTYNTCLLREPKGLLFLDRAEPRADGKLNVEFWDFEDEHLYLVDVLDSSEPIEVTRFGFGNQAVTYYQSTQEDGIICGSSSYDRKMSLDVLNNSPENRLGVTKIKVKHIK